MIGMGVIKMGLSLIGIVMGLVYLICLLRNHIVKYLMLFTIILLIIIDFFAHF